ncbi:MAG: BON domain-containing protein [Parachlamydiaceae bacterium]|nr:BON domain-containing protein [Parachlamydiaceae bacterium]
MKNIIFTILLLMSVVLFSCDSHPKSKPSNIMPMESAASAISLGDTYKTEADQELLKQIRHTFHEDPSVEHIAQHIHVKIINGQVSLRGIVSSRQEKEHLIDKVKDIHSIKRMSEHLEISGRETVFAYTILKPAPLLVADNEKEEDEEEEEEEEEKETLNDSSNGDLSPRA